MGIALNSFSLEHIHCHRSLYFKREKMLRSKLGKAKKCLPGWLLKTSVSLNTLSNTKTSSLKLAWWWVPLVRVTCSSLSVVSIIAFNTPTDLLTRSADSSVKFGPLFFRKAFRKLFKCSRCRSRGMFLPLPPFPFQNLFHFKLCASRGDKVALSCTVRRKVLYAYWVCP